ncbi:MAG: MBL fold metallo-hydrolase [Kofleriaceae bacterium]|nr:MBL fold metallo-hydrolase [Myxococcales bacterium]MCB9561959.1 MBL fold metallo-hydrolase [Kofleriaceae bacterium]MCB9573128.1 MBL fold metallo-hydrolase [Kofleriaceae bacterium]
MKPATLLATTLLLAACGGADATTGAGATAPATPVAPHLHVDVYAAAESNVNSYVVSDDAGAILIDATRNSADARGALALARATGHDPSLVFVTHGHPDHFLGLGALRAEVPGLRIVVATEAIKQDVIGFATWMDGQGWLDGEPGMKPRSAAAPDGFDYAGAIEVLDGDHLVLPGGEALEVRADYPAAEAAHTSTLYAPQLGALFASDLAYHDVHLWLGVGVTRDAAAAWQQVAAQLAAAYPATTTIYPGHGAPTDPGVFAAVRGYIDDLLAVADAAADDQAAIDAMVAKYPGYANRDFLLTMSVANQRQLARP